MTRVSSNSTAIDPGLAALLSEEESRRNRLPLTIRRFVDEQDAKNIVDAALRATERILVRHYQTEKSIPPKVRLTGIADMLSVSLNGLNHIKPSWSHKRPSKQSYRAAITMGPEKTIITVPPGSDRASARISVAHELGHLLIHSRTAGIDLVTVKLGSTHEEEALAEYLGRLLLLWRRTELSEIDIGSVARVCFKVADSADVPLTTVLRRLGDPEQAVPISGVILWELRRDTNLTLAERLKPCCPLCGTAFVPFLSHAREGSLTAQVAGGEQDSTLVGEESVAIGGFVGDFQVEAFGWGSENRGTRKVLTFFFDTRPVPARSSEPLSAND